jgi:glycosyltransferase involved in cell wall biosynthesis
MFAERMARYHQVEVLTTRAIDYVTWRNEYPEGTTSLNGVTVRRFRVGRVRDRTRFDRLSHRVFREAHDPSDEKRWVLEQGPYAPHLLRYLEKNRTAYDLFVFQTYLYYTSYRALPIVADRAILIPTAHDEPPIYLGVFDSLFRQARYLLCLTPEELAFLKRRFFDLELSGEVLGAGLDPLPQPAPDPQWDALRALIGECPFVLYAGRIDEAKGCDTMLEFFERYVAEASRPDLKLVMLGRAEVPLRAHSQVVAPGFVPESTKVQALRNCHLMIAPSPNESLCIAALEAWQAGKPVLANGQCPVLRGQCRRSNGGLWYTGYEEFREGMDRLVNDRDLAQTLGRQGQTFVEANYTWEVFDRRAVETLSWAAEGFKSGRRSNQRLSR